MGGVCIAASRFYKSKRNIILGAGILFVAAGNFKISYVHLWVDIICICACTCVSVCAQVYVRVRVVVWRILLAITVFMNCLGVSSCV